MRKIHLTALLLALLLLLVGCTTRFERDADGYGFTNTKTDKHYTVLDSNYEAAGAGSEMGEYTDKAFDYTVVFYQIPDQDPERFLTDSDGQVYCSDETLPDAASWTVSAVLICLEDSISVEMMRWTDAEKIAAVTDAWFCGEEAQMPLGSHSTFYRFKLMSNDYPGIYYCFGFYAYEDGSAYFYDISAARSVLCPTELAALLIAAGE